MILFKIVEYSYKEFSMFRKTLYLIEQTNIERNKERKTHLLFYNRIIEKQNKNNIFFS